MEVANLKGKSASVQNKPPEPSPVPLAVIGSLWILLAAAILIYQVARPARIEIEWVTETEFDTAGFNIYRAESQAGEFTQLNERLIPSNADLASGSTYTYVDNSISSGQTYYYVLEDVELDGTLVRHEEEIIAGNFTRFEWWALVSIPVSTLVGLLLLFTGISRMRKKPIVA